MSRVARLHPGQFEEDLRNSNGHREQLWLSLRDVLRNWPDRQDALKLESKHFTSPRGGPIFSYGKLVRRSASPASHGIGTQNGTPRGECWVWLPPEGAWLMRRLGSRAHTGSPRASALRFGGG